MQGFDLTIEVDKDEPEAAEILVDGYADGVLYRFLLDTGSSKTILKYDETTKTIPSSGSLSLLGLFGKIECDLIQVEEFSLGTIYRAGFELARMSKNGPARSQIGMDLLKGSCLHFCFDKNRVAVVSEAHEVELQNLIPLFLDKKSVPFINLKLDQLPATCFWDSGAGITCVDFKFIDKNPNSFSKLGSLGVEDTAEKGNVDMPLFLMRNLSHGSQNFPPHRVVGVDLSQVNSKMEKPVDIVLGFNTLAKANWLLDFPNRKWAINEAHPPQAAGFQGLRESFRNFWVDFPLGKSSPCAGERPLSA